LNIKDFVYRQNAHHSYFHIACPSATLSTTRIQQNHKVVDIQTELNDREKTLEEQREKAKREVGSEVSIALINTQVSQVDDLKFENIRDELKVDSLLLLNDLMDIYVPSINRWNEIDKEFST